MIGEAPSHIRTHEAAEHDFVVRSLRAVGLNDSDANDVANVLVAADLRGVESHGIARLDTFYVRRIEAGVVNARPSYTTLCDRPTQFALDAGNGLGHPAGIFAMRTVIEKARESGLAFATVRNSNHYGIAAYYAMMALEHDLIGLSMTNSTHLAVPTFGRQKTQGTNPIAVAIPADGHAPFVLDMATTGVTFGRLEVSERKGKPLKPGWAVDEDGRETRDATGTAPRTAATKAMGSGRWSRSCAVCCPAGCSVPRFAWTSAVCTAAPSGISSARSASTRCATAVRSSAISRASWERSKAALRRRVRTVSSPRASRSARTPSATDAKACRSIPKCGTASTRWQNAWALRSWSGSPLTDAVRVREDDLAAFVGATRVSVNRALADLAQLRQ